MADDSSASQSLKENIAAIETFQFGPSGVQGPEGFNPDDPDWFVKGYPPPGWLDRVNSILLAKAEDPTLQQADLEKHLFPKEKHEDQWTVTKKFRTHLLEWLRSVDGVLPPSSSPHEEKKAVRPTLIVEVGTYVGYTARFLSYHVDRVVSIDRDPLFVAINQKMNSDRSNVQVLLVEDSTTFDWRGFGNTLVAAFWREHYANSFSVICTVWE